MCGLIHENITLRSSATQIRVVSEVAGGQISFDSLLACINMGTLMFPLQGLSSVNTWSQFGYVLNNALLLLFVGDLWTSDLWTSDGGANTGTVFIMSPKNIISMWDAVVWKSINMAILWTP